MIPTADQVAIAIVEASRLVGVDPISVATGTPDNAAVGYQIAHARSYAALALDRVFYSNAHGHRPRLARLCGVTPGSQQTFISGLLSRIKRGHKVAWYSGHILEQVIAAIDLKPIDIPAVLQPKVKLTADYRPVTNTFELPGKRKLRDILAEAAANTAKLPVGE